MNSIFYTLFAITALFTSSGCEQHSAKKLPEHYQKDHGHGHGDSHGAHGDHAKADTHASEEKKAH